MHLAGIASDSAGRELIVRGVALNHTSGGLVSLATPEGYRSGVSENFVSVYDTAEQIRKGQFVRLRVLVETCRAYPSQRTRDGAPIVTIDAAFKERLK